VIHDSNQQADLCSGSLLIFHACYMSVHLILFDIMKHSFLQTRCSVGRRVKGARRLCGDTGRDRASAHEMSKSPRYSGTVGGISTHLTLKAGAGACALKHSAQRAAHLTAGVTPSSLPHWSHPRCRRVTQASNCQVGDKHSWL
jgi:hypothetical protein